MHDELSPAAVAASRIGAEHRARRVEEIARGQLAGEDRAVSRAVAQSAPPVFIDTVLVSTVVYIRHYFGDCPGWVESAAYERRGDLYLLHHTDVPWVADGFQREQPERRPELFARFTATLERFGVVTRAIQGAWDERRRRALSAIDEALTRDLQVARQP